MCINVFWTDRISMLCCDVPRARSDGDPRKSAKSIPSWSVTRVQGQISAMNRTKLEEGTVKTTISWFSCRSWLVLVFVYATSVGITPVPRFVEVCLCVCFFLLSRSRSSLVLTICRSMSGLDDRRTVVVQCDESICFCLLGFLWLLTNVQSQRRSNSTYETRRIDEYSSSALLHIHPWTPHQKDTIWKTTISKHILWKSNGAKYHLGYLQELIVSNALLDEKFNKNLSETNHEWLRFYFCYFCSVSIHYRIDIRSSRFFLQIQCTE